MGDPYVRGTNVLGLLLFPAATHSGDEERARHVHALVTQLTADADIIESSEQGSRPRLSRVIAAWNGPPSRLV